MSKRIGNVIIIEEEEPDVCELCGKLDELRPYGPGWKRICHDCAMEDPRGTERRMRERLFGEKPVN